MYISKDRPFFINSASNCRNEQSLVRTSTYIYHCITLSHWYIKSERKSERNVYWKFDVVSSCGGGVSTYFPLLQWIVEKPTTEPPPARRMCANNPSLYFWHTRNRSNRYYAIFRRHKNIIPLLLFSVEKTRKIKWNKVRRWKKPEQIQWFMHHVEYGWRSYVWQCDVRMGVVNGIFLFACNKKKKKKKRAEQKSNIIRARIHRKTSK